MNSILIIEDEAGICRNMEYILKREGFTVRTACDGTTGLVRVSEKVPDLILCDILMPQMDGLSFFEQLKREPEYADIPFIFVTALGSRAEIRRGLSAGADDYLIKPFTSEELIATVTGRMHRIEMIRQCSSKFLFKDEVDILRKNISKRELEVLLMVGHGATSKEIAERLCISRRTAEAHRTNLMHKLAAANVAMLTRWAVIAEQVLSPL